jgi:5-methylcytosine-specific restriction endonuclease McrA
MDSTVKPRIKRNTRLVHRTKEVIDHCEMCGWKGPEAKLLHAHHIIGLSVGGADTLDNLAILCPNCHAVAHYVTSRALGSHVGPSTRDELFYALGNPDRPMFSLDELRRTVDMLDRRGLIP